MQPAGATLTVSERSFLATEKEGLLLFSMRMKGSTNSWDSE